MILFKRGGAAALTRTADDDERVFQEIESTLRVTGVGAALRSLARHEGVFPAVWDALRPNVETRAF